MSELKPVNDLGIALSQKQVEAFATFQDRLYAKNLVMNLTRVPKEECWERHFADSLTLCSLIPEAATVLDVGSGPGFPGICLAIARKDISVTLLDSSGKALHFARAILEELAMAADIVEGRAEELAHEAHLRGSFDFVTGRAVAPLQIQAEISSPFARIGGRFVSMRTPHDHACDFAEFGLKLLGEHRRRFGISERKLIEYEKVAAAPPEFPRPWAKIKRAQNGA
ncbi:MAG TPA: 16S rRNA (guanine(527)-N(7))-methyltransferase RsmG [Fimbriimonadales bacterium]|jgi:16S rRNA (guanine527-N7)-methyltransferase|nr:16S rRNA (guanine(527)-N(7))-methyltransferase RsmG [Fimbriimonadales bacterium]